MDKIFSTIFQCGAFVLVPLFTFGLGVRTIVHRLGFNHRFASVAMAILLGFVFFEASLIGMVIDPRSASVGFTKLLEIAGLIGLGVFIFILISGPIYQRLLHIFRP